MINIPCIYGISKSLLSFLPVLYGNICSFLSPSFDNKAKQILYNDRDQSLILIFLLLSGQKMFRIVAESLFQWLIDGIPQRLSFPGTWSFFYSDLSDLQIRGTQGGGYGKQHDRK